MPLEAVARERQGPSRPRPWLAVAVDETAGSVGSDEGSSRPGHGSATDPSPKSDLVTEMPGTPHFLASSSFLPRMSSQFSALCAGNCELILVGASLPDGTVTEVRPS